MIETPIRDRDDQYMRAGELLIDIGRDGFGIPISSESAQRLGGAMLLISEVDAVIDDTRPEAEPAKNHILELIHNKDSEEAWAIMQESSLVGDKIKELTTQLRRDTSAEDCDIFLTHARGIIAEQDNERQNASARTRSHVAGRVGDHSAGLLLTMFSAEEREHPKFERYARCIRYLGQCGAIADWAQDLKEDYEDGLTQVKPSLLNQAIIVSGSAGASLRAAKEMGTGIFKVTDIVRKLLLEGARSVFATSSEPQELENSPAPAQTPF